MSKLRELEQKITAELQAAATIEAVEAARVRALGKKGQVSELLKSLGAMSAAERQEKGPLFNGLKLRLLAAVEAKRAALRRALTAQRLETERVDVTLPVRPSPAEEGRIHPISQVIDEVSAIFASMGFTVAEGPDIETEYYNFTALNFPEGHPAREMHDTFFMQAAHGDAAHNESDKTKPIAAQARAMEKRKRHKTAEKCGFDGNGSDLPQNNAAEKSVDAHKKVLRTHTSPAQIRTMEKTPPPLRIIIPGKTYRMDSDATHSPMFHQLEGLVVDKSANIAQMMWVLERFCARFFEAPAVKMRFRPSFFPFTEPSMEVDIQCDRSNAEVKFGQGADWLEVLGCGMVHPNVLRAGGLDPEEYQGFAWGMGLDRLAMLKYGMPDLRAFFESDLRWLKHYGFRPLDIPGLLSSV